MTAVAEAMNGGAFAQRSVDDHILTRIQSALSLVHSPHSANETRQDAQKFLENVKALDEAPSHGFALASNRAQTPIVRHYGLSLLEHAIRRRWAAYTAEQAQYLRQWILQLSEGVSRDDPAYLRSKIAQLWVDVAKRCWGSEWMDMDELLCRLWLVPDAPALKEFVLQVLEILSEDVFSNNNGEDPVVALREGELSKASVEIFTPAAVLVEVFPNRQPGPNVRFGKEGWLPRITELLGRCIEGDVQANEHLAECAIRSLAVLNSLMVWILPKAVIDAGCVRVICTALATPRLTVQKVRDCFNH